MTVKVDDIEVTLRFFTDKDSEDLLSFYRDLPEEDRMFLKQDVTNRKIFEMFISSIRMGLVTTIIAIHEGRIIGEACLHIHRHGWTRHVGELRLILKRGYTGKGLTRVMLREMVDVANAKGLDKIVFRILESQKDSRKALEEVGFQMEAVLKHHATDLNGSKHDMIIMSNYVAELWRMMEDLIRDTDFEKW
ncbi:MAG: GNAT family protein [Pseudomonadota bacterium]